MESALTRRFMRVAKRFGQGLQKIMKGNILFLSLGLLTQLLNPLQKIHDKIKDLLGQGADLEEFSDKLGISPADLVKLESIGKTLGLAPDRLRDMLTKYADAVEKAREELSDPTKERSLGTMAIADIIDKGLVDGFQEVLRRIVQRGRGPTARESSTAQLTLEEAERHGLARDVTGAEQRRRLERDIFGEDLTGAAKRLAESDLAQILKQLNLGGFGDVGPGKLEAALANLNQVGRQERADRARQDVDNLTRAGNAITPSMINGLLRSEQKDENKTFADMTDYERLNKISGQMEEITKLISQAVDATRSLVGWMGEFIPLAKDMITEAKSFLNDKIPSLSSAIDSIKESMVRLPTTLKEAWRNWRPWGN